MSVVSNDNFQEAEPKIWVSELPPTARQKWSAAALMGLVLVVFGALVPIATRPAAQLNAFFPSLDAIVLITDLITAVLLFTHFSISRSPSLMALASGYLFTAVIVIPHALTFAGAFSPSGLLGANNQTGSWLFIFWHFGFGASLLAYAILRKSEGRGTKIKGSTRRNNWLYCRGNCLPGSRSHLALHGRIRAAPGDHHSPIHPESDGALSYLGHDCSYGGSTRLSSGSSAFRPRLVANGRRGCIYYGTCL